MRPQRCPLNTAAFSCLTKPAHLAATHPPSQATKSVARPAGEPRPALQALCHAGAMATAPTPYNQVT